MSESLNDEDALKELLSKRDVLIFNAIVALRQEIRAGAVDIFGMAPKPDRKNLDEAIDRLSESLK